MCEVLVLLDKNKARLVRELSSSTILADLVNKGVISASEKESVACVSDVSEKCEFLIEILKEKSVDAIRDLCFELAIPISNEFCGLPGNLNPLQMGEEPARLMDSDRGSDPSPNHSRESFPPPPPPCATIPHPPTCSPSPNFDAPPPPPTNEGQPVEMFQEPVEEKPTVRMTNQEITKNINWNPVVLLERIDLSKTTFESPSISSQARKVGRPKKTTKRKKIINKIKSQHRLATLSNSLTRISISGGKISKNYRSHRESYARAEIIVDKENKENNLYQTFCFEHRNITCGPCGVTFSTKKCFDYHLEEWHGVKTQHVCHLCKLIFPLELALETHSHVDRESLEKFTILPSGDYLFITNLSAIFDSLILNLNSNLVLIKSPISPIRRM